MLTFFLRVERQVGLGFSWLLKGRRNRKVQSLCVTSLVSDGSSIAENKKVSEGLLLGPERDGSGSVVGFQLIPHSCTAPFCVLEFEVNICIYEFEIWLPSCSNY